MIQDLIDPFVFLLAFCIGLFYTYLKQPYPEVIIKYPTPFNAGKITYRDDNNVCYKYHIKKVKCPSDKNKVVNFKPADYSSSSKA